MLKRAKGFWGDRKNHMRITKEAVVRAMANNYKDRKIKKRDFRALWITRLSVAAKIQGLSYSKFICGLQRANILLNRKVLSDMAIRDPEGFKQVALRAKEALAQ